MPVAMGEGVDEALRALSSRTASTRGVPTDGRSRRGRGRARHCMQRGVDDVRHRQRSDICGDDNVSRTRIDGRYGLRERQADGNHSDGASSRAEDADSHAVGTH